MSLQKHISCTGQWRIGWIACLILIPLFWGVSLSSAAWVATGSATVNGNDIIVTPESGNQAGAAWLDTPIDLTSDFDITLSGLKVRNPDIVSEGFLYPFDRVVGPIFGEFQVVQI